MPANLLDLTMNEAIRRALPVADRETQAWKIGLVQDMLETPEDMRDRALSALSGGWQRLAMIARVWVTDPDVLLLDEPTNHLDLQRLAVLEDWVNHATEGVAMVIASHDRQFLDSCTNRTLFLRPDDQRTYAHPFSRARDLLAEDDAAREAKLARDAKEAVRLRRNAGQLRNVGINSGSDLLLKKAKYLTNRAEAIEQSLRPLAKTRDGDIRLTNRGTHAKVLIEFDNVPIATPDGVGIVRYRCAEDLSAGSHRGDRCQWGRQIVVRPSVAPSDRWRSGFRHYGQPDRSGGLRRSVDVAASARGHTAWFHNRTVPVGGSTERQPARRRRFRLRRATPADRTVVSWPEARELRSMLALRLTEPNFYLMDEPTNHVDIAGQERLETEILAHEATCVLVSHDRFFVRAIGTRFLRIEERRIVEMGSAGW